jgi:hypothetical protein
MDEILDTNSGKLHKRDELGRLLPGQPPLNPKGRPPTSLSIKDAIRKRLEEHPEEVEEIVKHFIEKNRELMWTMLEGSPKATSEIKSQHTEISITGEDLLLAQKLREQRELRQGSSSEGDGTNSQPVDRKVQD